MSGGASGVRVAVVGAFPFPSPQGSQVFVGQLCERLARAGHSVDLLTYGHGLPASGTSYRHVRISRLPGDDASRSGPSMVKVALDVMMLRALVALTRDRDVQVVHAHNYEAAVVALAARAVTGCPVVYHSHNLMGDELPTYFAPSLLRRAAGAFGRGLDRNVPRRADHVIALCDYTRGLLESCGVVRERMTVLPPAIEDLGRVEPSSVPLPFEDLRKAEFLVGYSGNLDGYQNLPLLLQGFGRFVRELGRRDAHLVIATHDRDPTFVRGVDDMGLGGAVSVVEVHGFAQVQKIMDACDVLALPRRLGSGYPIKLLNYMSAGKPVISAGCGGKVLRDRHDGIVVADDDSLAMAEGLRLLQSEPALRQRLGDAARHTYLERMTWEATLPAVEALYERVLTDGGSRQTSANGSKS